MDTERLPEFFERVTRQAFGDLRIDDPPVAGYVTDLLTRFARAEALYRPFGAATRRLDTVVDSLLEIQHAWDPGGTGFSPEREEALRRHIGDFALFMVGVFRDHVERISATGFYQREGERAYRFVSETARVSGKEEASLFLRLSRRFEHYAGALTYMRKVYMAGSRLPWSGPPAGPLPSWS